VSEFRIYAALAAFPLIWIFVFDWWHAGWAAKHHTLVLPPEIARKREESNRPLVLAKYALLLLVMRDLVGNRLWQIVPVSVHSQPWVVLLASGIVCGIVIVSLQTFLSSLSVGSLFSKGNEYFLRGSVSVWLIIFLIGGLVEEFWRAICIRGLVRNGHGPFSANLLTAFAFSVAHQSGLPSRIAPGLGVAATEVVIALVFGALFIWSGNIIPPILASVIYYIFIFFSVRRSGLNTSRPSGSAPT